MGRRPHHRVRRGDGRRCRSRVGRAAYRDGTGLGCVRGVRRVMSRVGREEDMRMLREVLDTERLDSGTRAAFNDMLHDWKFGHRWGLSDAQREWVKKHADPTYENLVSRRIVSRV